MVWSGSETLNYPHSPCSQCSFCSAVVQRGPVGLNHSELMLHSLTDLVHCVIWWFDQVQKHWTTPNLCLFTLYFCSAVVIRRGSVGLNHSGGIEPLRWDWTTPDSCYTLRQNPIEPSPTTPNICYTPQQIRESCSCVFVNVVCRVSVSIFMAQASLHTMEPF